MSGLCQRKNERERNRNNVCWIRKKCLRYHASENNNIGVSKVEKNEGHFSDLWCGFVVFQLCPLLKVSAQLREIQSEKSSWRQPWFSFQRCFHRRRPIYLSPVGWTTRERVSVRYVLHTVTSCHLFNFTKYEAGNSLEFWFWVKILSQFSPWKSWEPKNQLWSNLMSSYWENLLRRVVTVSWRPKYFLYYFPPFLSLVRLLEKETFPVMTSERQELRSWWKGAKASWASDLKFLPAPWREILWQNRPVKKSFKYDGSFIRPHFILDTSKVQKALEGRAFSIFKMLLGLHSVNRILLFVTKTQKNNSGIINS